MAIFRKLHVSFWSDTFISELPNDKKLFYLYLLTNERTRQCGIYEISKKQICFDLGYSIDTVSILLQYFIDIKKIKYSENTNEIAIKNWAKYNYSSSPKVKKCIENELKIVKNKVLIEYVNGINTLSQEEEEEEEEKIYIDTEYYNKFLEKWNLYGSKYKDRKVKLTSLQYLDKQNLKTIKLPIEEISKALFILFNQNSIIESCLVTPKHFLLDFQKYYQAGLEYEKSKNIIQFYKSNN
jgi:hypothetical protein